MIRLRRVAGGVVIGAGLLPAPAAYSQTPPGLPPAPAAAPRVIPPEAAPECPPPAADPGRAGFVRRLFQPPPPAPPAGYYLGQWQSAQIAKAELQKLFVTAHEWYMGGATLGPGGRRHLGRLARGLLDGTAEIYLEPGTDPKLDRERQLHLVNELLRFGVTDAKQRVVLAYPLGEGLYGEDSQMIYPRLFITRGSGAGFGGGFGGGGFGGAGGGLGGFGGGGFGGLGGGFGGGFGRFGGGFGGY